MITERVRGTSTDQQLSVIVREWSVTLRPADWRSDVDVRDRSGGIMESGPVVVGEQLGG